MKAKKKIAKKAIVKTKKTILKKNVDTTITEALKKKVFPYIVDDIINACHSAKIGQSIRIGKLGRLKKTKRRGEINGHAYNKIIFSWKSFSTLKNN